MRSRNARVSATGESCRRSIRLAASAMVRKCRSVVRVTASLGIARVLSYRRARADFVGHLARQELAILRIAEELPALHHHLAAEHGHAGPRRHHMAFPRRVVGLM